MLPTELVGPDSKHIGRVSFKRGTHRDDVDDVVAQLWPNKVLTNPSGSRTRADRSPTSPHHKVAELMRTTSEIHLPRGSY